MTKPQPKPYRFTEANLNGEERACIGIWNKMRAVEERIPEIRNLDTRIEFIRYHKQLEAGYRARFGSYTPRAWIVNNLIKRWNLPED